MSRIQQLDPHVVNRIAAGEVIERPGSVVKELLENSVDAGATRIEIDVADGGMQLIRISDNGGGIHPDDLLLAVTSHATSKIRSDSDLNHVSTLGFRGEALASIASVSRCRIRTRTADCPNGSELECSGGTVTQHQECGCRQGTVIAIHNLFFNTPARRKFLKRASTEFGHIAEQFNRVALANPSLHLVLRHNDKLVHELPATSDTLDRIRRFCGSDMADKLIAVESATDLPTGDVVRLWGYVAEPSVSKSTRKSQYLFLNGRWIQDRSLQHALAEAYRGLLMVGRHPLSYLFLELPPGMVDVNVHPTKSEVRFQDSQILYRQLLKTLRDKFLSLDFRSDLALEANPSRNTLKLQPAATNANTRQQELNLWASQASGVALPRVGAPDNAPNIPAAVTSGTDLATSGLGIPGAGPVAEFQPFPSSSTDIRAPRPLPETNDWDQSASAGDATEQKTNAGQQSSTDDTESPPEDQPPDVESTATFVQTDEFRAFQIHDCYLVVATDAGLEVIDQHALHERILYEHLRQRILSGTVERQKLLIPEAIELSATESAVLAENVELMSEIGFEIEEFGGTTVLLTACPVLIPRGGLTAIVKDMVEQLEQKEGKATRRDLLDRMLHTMSCRAAIKSGKRLTVEEMRELLRQRHLVDDSHHCPHGRPTALTLTRDTLDQQFGRMG
jgi:DNA mismatch repair protein MutL